MFNQSKPFLNIDLYRSDRPLMRAVEAFGGLEHEKKIAAFGRSAGTACMFRVAELAEENKPVLHQFDAYGRRLDEVEYHPSYHLLMNHGISAGCAAFGHNTATPAGHVARAAILIMENQLEPGHCCPITMTSAAVPVLRQDPGCSEWLGKVLSQVYDPSDRPLGEKTGCILGMSMTEKQGGSDVRSNTTVARPAIDGVSGAGSGYLLRGHKWFTSAPMSDGFLTLAQTSAADGDARGAGAAPSCFLVPRYLPDGTRNTGFQVQRLKNKLGDRANASRSVGGVARSHGVVSTCFVSAVVAWALFDFVFCSVL